MRHLIIATVSATVLASGSAFAADLRVPVRAPTPAAVVAYNWSGFYIGAHGGGAWGDKEWLFTGPLTTTDHRVKGAFAGGQIGYNWQFGSWVFGLEGEGSWADLTGSSTCPNPAAVCESEVRWLASATGRLGYAIDNWLLYVKGGWAGAGDRYFVRFPATPALDERSGNISRSGWTVGGGVEVGFAQNWSAKVEYMYADLGRETFDFTRIATGAFVETAQVDQTIHTVKFGINYHFNAFGPVVARY